jgi:hypothetical protein
MTYTSNKIDPNCGAEAKNSIVVIQVKCNKNITEEPKFTKDPSTSVPCQTIFVTEH